MEIRRTGARLARARPPNRFSYSSIKEQMGFKIMVFEQFNNGIKLINPLNVERDNFKYEKQPPKRGKVRQFSNKSRKRLIELLLKCRFERPAAITLTLAENPSDFQKLFKFFSRKMVQIGLSAVWRVELQTRGVPHLHLVADVPDIEVASKIWSSWVATVDNFLPYRFGFLEYGTAIRWLDGSGWFKYLALHAGKHKASQLGWEGRQWGIINRPVLCIDETNDVFQILPGHEEKICRIFRWLCKYRDFHFDFFGSRNFFLTSDEIKRIKARHCFNLPF